MSQRLPKLEMTYYRPPSTILQNFSSIAQTVYEICVTKVFSLFGPWGLTPGPKFTNDLSQRLPKGEMTYYPLRSTTLQNFSPIVQTIYDICVTKFFHILALILTPQGYPMLIWRCQWKAGGFYDQVLPGSNLVSVTVFGIFRVKI